MSARFTLKDRIGTIDHHMLSVLGLITTGALGAMVFVDVGRQEKLAMSVQGKAPMWGMFLLTLLCLAFGWFFIELVEEQRRNRRKRRGEEITTDLTARAAQLRGEYPPPRLEHPSIPDLFPASEIAVMLRRRLPAHKIAINLQGLGFPLEAIARALFDIDRTQEQVREGLLELGATAQTVESVLGLTISRLGREPARGQRTGALVQLQDVHLIELFGRHEMPLQDVANWLYRAGVDTQTIGVILSQLRASPEQIDQVLAQVSQLLQYAPDQDGDPSN